MHPDQQGMLDLLTDTGFQECNFTRSQVELLHYIMDIRLLNEDITFPLPAILHHKTIALHIKHPPVCLRFTFLEDAVLINSDEQSVADVDILPLLPLFLE